MGWLFNNTVSGLEGALDRTFLREKTISQNIANIDTPNYKAKDVSFKDELNRKLRAYRTDPRHLEFSSSSDPSAYVHPETKTTFNNNGNNVDMDREMTALAENQIRYQALVTRLNSEFQGINRVLRGGN
jgi:flagellar basal-body rod protein FlgB